MKRLCVFVICFALGLFSAPIMAQDSTIEAPACDLESLQNNINYAIGALGKLKTETDTIKIADQIQILVDQANSLRATCDGLVFTGSEARVIGPVTFPAGIYKATATADNDNGINAIVTAVSGECGEGLTYYSTLLFAVSKGEATLGSKGCTAIIEVKSYSGNWKLSFERMTTG